MPRQEFRTVCTDRQALFQRCADDLVALAREAITDHGTFHLALAGGSTPQGFYQLLATPDYRRRIDWSRCHIYFSDERCVPHDDIESNFRMAREALLDHVSLPLQQCHPIPTDSTPEADAARYHQLLAEQSTLGEGPPRLDLILLGIGSDGHTASLFPGTPILQERDRYAAAVYVPHLASWRISLTYPLLNAARACWLIAAGHDKAAIITQALGPTLTPPLPVQRIDLPGRLHWYLDQAAAAQLMDP